MRNYFSKLNLPGASDASNDLNEEVATPEQVELSSTIDAIVKYDPNLHKSSVIALLEELRENGDNFSSSLAIDFDDSATQDDWLDSNRLAGAWVAVRGDELLGFVSLIDTSDFIGKRIVSRENCFEVDRLFVRPMARRKGIGSLLLEHARLFAHEQNKRICFQVNENLPQAISFCSRQNRFICISSFYRGDTVDHIYVERVTWREARNRFRTER